MTLDPVALAVFAAAAFVGALLAALLRRPPDLGPLATAVAGLKSDLDRLERLTREAEMRARDSADDRAGKLREELAGTLGRLGADLRETSRQLAEAQRDSLNMMISRVGTLAETTEKSQQQLRESLDKSFVELRGDNAAKLEEMRRTVDEKLQDSLEKRFVASFKTVSDQLESVHKGLGEMQTLATGVGDLKKLLSGVKTRGTFGEVQLGALLDQFLSPGQYERNARPRPDTNEVVEYAVRLPEAIVPIDCKFPQEDYARLLQAIETADAAAVEAAGLKVERSVRIEAKRIADKYINPPVTTDFAILFLPTEGLFAEVIRRPGLCESIQHECRVLVTGPSTLAALLMSLGMGFRTMAIQQRSKEVWEVLGAVKTEFATYGALMDKVGKKLEEGQKVIEQVGTRTRAIQRKLRAVEALPEAEARPLLEPELALDAIVEEPES